MNILLKPITPCSTCVGWEWGQKGYVPASGSGENGILIVAEAAGENEANEGMPLVGKAGHYLFQQLQRVGIEREGFRVHNVLSCRPPDNKLSKQPYEDSAIQHCSPLLDETITSHVAQAVRGGKTPVILTLGQIAFRRIAGLVPKSALLREDYLCYPIWSDRYNCWVIAADHPSYLMRGSNHLVPVLQYAFKRALEIAEGGLTLDTPNYLLDPAPSTFAQWVRDYLQYALEHEGDTFLSYDIETPYKQGKNEGELANEDSDDYQILRCSFAYRENEAVSVPWRAEYLPMLEELFTSVGAKVGWNSCPTPDQRILTADLRWIPAGNLKVGDKLVGLDEVPQQGRRLRRYKSTVVTHAARSMAHVVEIVFSDGSKVKATVNHPWLIAQRFCKKRASGSEWTPTDKLKIGQRIQRVLDPWELLTGWKAGYLAGFFDGEGHFTKDPAGVMRVGAAQNRGSTLDLVLGLLDEFGFRSREKHHTREKDKHCINFIIPNGVNGSARFLGSVRPQRLLSKFTPDALGAVWAYNTTTLTISEINDLGQQEIVELSTSEKTYILEGFASHNSSYDDPRIMARVPINGDRHDAMLCWHVLNSALDKSLGFVTPFYVKSTGMWKHLADSEPAFYNAKDADMALRNFLGIKRDLERANLWQVYDRHVVQLNRALQYMSSKGVLRDEVMRSGAEQQLQDLLDVTELSMEAAVPLAARKLKVWKRQPKVITPDIFAEERPVPVRGCLKCGELKPSKKHHQFCDGVVGQLLMPTKVWLQPLEFKVSKLGLSNYQKALRHQAVTDRRTQKVTFDEAAIMKLMKHHPLDPLYPKILEHREYQKLLSTYIGITQPDGWVKGGMPVSGDHHS